MLPVLEKSPEQSYLLEKSPTGFQRDISGIEGVSSVQKCSTYPALKPDFTGAHKKAAFFGG
jgi:hypothetical protein